MPLHTQGTINERNYREYLSAPGGQASSPLVVEGANLFVTDAARATLQDKGVALFKDASTNKVWYGTGVRAY